MSIVAKSTAENSEYSIDALSKCFLLGNLPAIFTLQVCHFTRRAEELPRIRSSSRGQSIETRAVDSTPRVLGIRKRTRRRLCRS
jgi:hypothetical protein